MRTNIYAAHGLSNEARNRWGMRVASTSTSAIVAFLIASTPAGALANTGQAAGESELPSDALPVAQSDEDIVVTGSRITRSGFEAPTPTTMVGTADIARQGAPNIAAVLNQVPSFLPSSTPATAGNNSTNVGGNFLNLRGLGATRTLVLVNGRRHVPTTPNGLVDVNLIPQALIRHLTSSRDAVVAGLLCGPLAALPAFLFYLCTMAYYPEIGSAVIPSDMLLAQLGTPWLHLIFQLMILAALLEGGVGLIHAINQRIAGVYEHRGRTMSAPTRLAAAASILVGAIFVASRFGLIELVAKGYTAFAYLIIAVYVVPLLTFGAWQLHSRARSA